MDHDTIERALLSGRPPVRNDVAVNLCLAIDRSGSMAGAKLAAAGAVGRALLARLSGDDRLTVVVYAEGADVVVTPQTRREDVPALLDGIVTGSASNLSLGWCQGLLELQAHTTEVHHDRLIILSDGRANAGETERSALAAIARRARAAGVTTSTIAVGDDHEADLLVAIAAASGGRFWAVPGSTVEDVVDEALRGTLAVARLHDGDRPVATGGTRVELLPSVEVVPAAGGARSEEHLGTNLAMREINPVVGELVEPYGDVPEVQVFIAHWRQAVTHGAPRGRNHVHEVPDTDEDAIIGVLADAIALTHLLAQTDPARAATLERHRATLYVLLSRFA